MLQVVIKHLNSFSILSECDADPRCGVSDSHSVTTCLSSHVQAGLHELMVFWLVRVDTHSLNKEQCLSKSSVWLANISMI